MKKFITTTLLLIFFFVDTKAQDATTKLSPAALYKQYYDFSRRQNNLDSAFHYFKLIFSQPEQVSGTLKMIIFDAFPDTFTDSDLTNLKDSVKQNHAIKIKLLHKALLQKIADDKVLRVIEPIEALLLWSKVQDNQQNKTQLIILSKTFVEQNSLQKDFHQGNTGRYGLMIYKTLFQHSDLKPFAQKLLLFLKEKIKNSQVLISDNTTNMDFRKRACHRYLYAYINQLQAQATDNIDQKQAFLKTAFEYSPDLNDKQNRNAYLFDKDYLGGKESYASDYLDFLVNHSKSQKEVLNTLLQIALSNPVYKETLAKFYQTMEGNKQAFSTFWQESIEKSALNAKSFTLIQSDKKPFSNKEQIGKWILLDFWGTWCTPCREEHPALQKFYDSTILQNTDKIQLLTIACLDTEEKVLKYMKEKNFSFPVAMSNVKIEKDYAIGSFPTKILITPKGKYIALPSTIELNYFIKQYCEL